MTEIADHTMARFHLGEAEPPPGPGPTISGAHRRTLEAIFRHPLAHYLEWREVVALITHIGRVEERSGDEFLFSVGGEHQFMRRPHHTKDLNTNAVMALRHLLERAGWSPSGAPRPVANGPATPPPALIAIIDHHEAQIWRVDLSAKDDGSQPGVDACDPRHFLHQMVQKTHRLDHGKTSADDRLFLEEIAGALADGGEIVVIGHGVGEANMAEQATAYLEARHPGIYRRIVREIVADLPGMSTTELLDLGRHALDAHATQGPADHA
jgi:hypothetical protein